MKLCLLAAGFAKRMYPLTRDRAKPLLEVGDQPMLSRLLGQARATGAIDASAVIFASRFAPEFESWNAGLQQPVKLVANGAREDTQARGAVADLAMLLESAFPSGAADGYLVLAGDNLLRFDLREAYERFAQRPGSPLLLARRVPEPVPPGKYSELVLDQDTDRVVSFREKPQDPRSALSAIGVYFLPPTLPELLQDYLRAGNEVDAPGHFLAWLTTQIESFAWRVPDGAWFDVGSIEGLDKARALAAQGAQGEDAPRGFGDRPKP
jgi:glucose-1-phosphate thymidylyltransferase